MDMNEKKLKKVLKDSVTNDKIRTGTKEVLQHIKGTNLILTSTSVSGDYLDRVKKLSEESNIPLYNFSGNSTLLGRLCGLSYRTNMVSLKNVSEEDIKSILS
jgi:ribosomal protein L7Ae-like RNA K-turn-binding protein